MALADCLGKARARDSGKTALVFGERSWTYAEVDDLTDRVAASLLRLGIRPGDRVALLLSNCPEVVLSYYACFKIGVAVVPVNTRLAGAEIEYILDHGGARILVSQPDLFGLVDPLRPRLGKIERCYLTDGAADYREVRPFAELLEAPRGDTTFPPVPDATVAAILYTSGTTARPKGVTHTHRTFERTITLSREDFHWNSADVTGVMTLFCHISGFFLLLTALDAGGTIVILPPFEPETVLRLLARHRITRTFGVPVMYNELAKCVKCSTAHDFGSLRYCLAGGDAVPVALQELFKKTFGLEITEICGMTEIAPYSVNQPGAENRVGSIGRAASGTTIRLVDDTGKEVPVGEPGEILVKSDAMMVGYWNDPVATAATIQGGWLHTGDLATVDREGYYWFVGRKKEIIVRGGSNISPLEVEAHLYQHPAVKEAGVIGVPHATLGEVVWAYVALKPGHAAAEQELRDFLRSRLAAFKVPESIALLPELPKGSTGKVQRKTLQELAIRQVKAEGSGRS